MTQLLPIVYARGRLAGEAELSAPPADLSRLMADLTSALFMAPPDLSPDADATRRAELDERDDYLKRERLDSLRSARTWPGDSTDPSRPWVAELVAVAGSR